MSCPLRSRGSHVKSGALFRLSLYLAVLVPCVWALLMSTENWILREILFSWVMLGSTVDTVHVSTLAFGSISHLFIVAADSNPDCVSSPFGLNGEECPVDASGCSFAPRSSHLECWTSFSSSTLLTPVMMAWIFRRIFYGFFRPPLRS